MNARNQEFVDEALARYNDPVSEIAERYGFSRERGRQLLKKSGGHAERLRLRAAFKQMMIEQRQARSTTTKYLTVPQLKQRWLASVAARLGPRDSMGCRAWTGPLINGRIARVWTPKRLIEPLGSRRRCRPGGSFGI